jgi:hypothetical protein
MNDPADPRKTSPGDIASSAEFAEISLLLTAVRHLSGLSLPGSPGESHGTVVQEARRKSRSMPTSALRAGVSQTLRLLDTRPPMDPHGYATSRRRLGALTSQRAIEDDWIARLDAVRRQARGPGGAATRKVLKADIQVRKQQRGRLVARERHAEWIVKQHERRLQALYDWQLDHQRQLLQGQWHAQTLLDRQEQVLDAIVARPPPYLLTELGVPPRLPEARKIWREGALAILRFRKDYKIQEPDRALGKAALGGSQRLRRSQVEVLVDQVRQLIEEPRAQFSPTEPFDVPDLRGP